MKTRSSSLPRILLEAGAVVVIHFVVLRVLARARLLEHLLAPGSQSYWAIAATAAFLLFRAFLYIFGPGWLLCRLWLCYTRTQDNAKPTLSTNE
jgi:hypothetical protein